MSETGFDTRRVHLRRALVAVGVMVATLCVGMPPAFADGPTVTGGGASFPSLLINQWRADVARPPLGIRINYSSAGSGFGRDKYISGALDFGQSDIPFLDEELPRVKSSGRGSFVYVPVVAGALAFMFNVVGTNGQRITNLRLTANDACRIFTEPDIKWN
ncbi:MAG: substrate-binding domain-containing protein, partial [Actinomycetes bacterium]